MRGIGFPLVHQDVPYTKLANRMTQNSITYRVIGRSYITSRHNSDQETMDMIWKNTNK